MKTKLIESSQNPIFKKLSSLHKSKGLQKEKQALLSGEKLILEYLKSSAADQTETFWVYHQPDHFLFDRLDAPQSLVQVPKALFEDLDLLGTHTPLLCIAISDLKTWNRAEAPTQPEVLCSLGDPNNLGALLRSCKAFGVNRVVLLQESCHPFHPKSLKASAGAALSLELLKGPSIQELSAVKNLVALDGQGESLLTAKIPQPWRLLMGEEGPGLPVNLKAQLVSIPMTEGLESLNATVAASVFLSQQFFTKS